MNQATSTVAQGRLVDWYVSRKQCFRRGKRVAYGVGQLFGIGAARNGLESPPIGGSQRT